MVFASAAPSPFYIVIHFLMEVTAFTPAKLLFLSKLQGKKKTRRYCRDSTQEISLWDPSWSLRLQPFIHALYSSRIMLFVEAFKHLRWQVSLMSIHGVTTVYVPCRVCLRPQAISVIKLTSDNQTFNVRACRSGHCIRPSYHPGCTVQYVMGIVH